MEKPLKSRGRVRVRVGRVRVRAVYKRTFRPLFFVSVSVSVSAPPYPDKNETSWITLGSILVRISIRIISSVNSVRIKWLTEPFYLDADDIRTSFSQMWGYNDIFWKESLLVTKFWVNGVVFSCKWEQYYVGKNRQIRLTDTETWNRASALKSSGHRF